MVDLAAQVERARQCWNSGDLEGYLALYDDSSKLHGYSPEPMRKAEVRAFYEQVCASLSEPGHRNPILEFHEIVTSGDLYCCRFTMRGVHRGPFLGVPATGRPYSIGGITMMRFAGNRVIERSSSADMLGLLVQIGAAPAPPS
jgi:predicted ester cyclase